MKKTLLIILVLLFQNSFSKPITETQKLAATCKIWGFLKYYHPNVADGSKNWDEQLFQLLPKVEQAKSAEEFSLVIENWIVSLGEIKACKAAETVKKENIFDKNFNFSWILKNELFSKSLSKKLKFIEENRIQGNQYYVRFQTDNPNKASLEFRNEIKYPDFTWKDKNLRILALFRYWNYVEYFFPYKYQMDQNWDTTLNEILPKIIAPVSDKDFALAMREIAIKLNDTHADTMSGIMYEECFGNKFAPVNIKIINEKAIITTLLNDSIAKIDDLQIGDVVTKVDGKTISEIIKEKKNIVEGSNRAAVLRNFNFHIFSGNSDNVQIEFIRDNKTVTKSIRRYPYQNLKIEFKDKEKWKFLEHNVAYANLSAIDENDVPILMDQFKNAETIIFDVREGSNGVNYAIAEYLNPAPKEFVKFIDVDLNYPGKFIWRSTSETCGKINADYYKGKVIVLVNEGTQSHAEYTVMTFQSAPNTKVIGSQTAGADGAVIFFPIIKGYSSKFTSYGVFYPNKKETQRVGIVPDVEVKPTILGIQQGKDEVLERAILFAKNGK